MCALTLANFHFLFDGLTNGNYWLAILCFFATAAGIWGIKCVYEIAKRIEEDMRRDIQTVMNLQLFDLMRKAFTNHPDAFQNGFRGKTKDNENEVEADK